MAVHYTWSTVELVLNLVWLVTSLLLARWWVRATRSGRARNGWQAIVSLCILLLLLFPVISMTDDLVAMSSPAEVEHLVRRAEVLATPSASIDPFETLTLVALLFAAIAWLCALMERLRPSPQAVRFLSGFTRVTGNRPPPVAA